MKRLAVTALALAVLLLAVSASTPAHGTTAYDTSKTLKLKGTVRSFTWVNPHASVAWDVTSPGMLTRSGWHHDFLKPVMR
jgi:uncharacterized protein DUF6152